jgi:hypothetical protein
MWTSRDRETTKRERERETGGDPSRDVLHVCNGSHCVSSDNISLSLNISLFFFSEYSRWRCFFCFYSLQMSDRNAKKTFILIKIAPSTNLSLLAPFLPHTSSSPLSFSVCDSDSHGTLLISQAS